jgi:UrcA family protein
MRDLPILAFAVIATCPLLTAHAEATATRRTETVRYADLDLNNHEGAATLFRRLHNAAADVCATPADASGPAAVPVYQRCIDHALGDAVSAVGQPALTAYAQARGVPLPSRTVARPN